ncbi:hypothetical protein F511_34148 [Dorcoceras hygrometricum]|uniref:Uncharacterized protein n=1 Tax=Dorcoceras hygrometricum TaxID=472368 RepID=A0A2Z7BWY4_9LAMI|nr:hypothetical protein F511_34148 [Dorcoceras hygrometricum]
MASSLLVNALQVNFDSLLTMENIGMIEMFKSLEESGLKVFLGASDSIYEEAVIEFFANANVIAGMIVNLVGTRKIAITKDMFANVFGLPSEGLTSFLNIPEETKVLTSKSVQTYIKKNSEIKPTGKSSKQNEDTASNNEGRESQGTQPVKKAKIMNRKKQTTAEEPRQKKRKERMKKLDGQSKATKTMGIQIKKPVMRKQTTEGTPAHTTAMEDKVSDNLFTTTEPFDKSEENPRYEMQMDHASPHTDISHDDQGEKERSIPDYPEKKDE